jgi:hypothetical protein
MKKRSKGKLEDESMEDFKVRRSQHAATHAMELGSGNLSPPCVVLPGSQNQPFADMVLHLQLVPVKCDVGIPESTLPVSALVFVECRTSKFESIKPKKQQLSHISAKLDLLLLERGILFSADGFPLPGSTKNQIAQLGVCEKNVVFVVSAVRELNTPFDKLQIEIQKLVKERHFAGTVILADGPAAAVRMFAPSFERLAHLHLLGHRQHSASECATR